MKKRWKLLMTAGVAIAGAHLGAEAFAEKVFRDFFVTDRKLGDRHPTDFLPTEPLKEQYENEVENHISWFHKTQKKELSLVSYDGLKLSGMWLIGDKTYPTVILCHGYNSDRYVLLKQAYEFSRLSYNVLMIDQRGYGSSEGEYTTFGFKESIDLAQWIDMLVSEDPDMLIGLYGISAGAVAVMMALGNELPSNVRFAVVEGGFASLESVARRMLPKDMIGASVFLHYFDRCIRRHLSISLRDVNPRIALRNNRVPICFIHSRSDELVPEEDAKMLYQENAGKKYYYPLEGMPHAYGCYVNDYFGTLNSFIQNCLH